MVVWSASGRDFSPDSGIWVVVGEAGGFVDRQRMTIEGIGRI